MAGVGVAELLIIFGVCACVFGPVLAAVVAYFVMKDRETK